MLGVPPQRTSSPASALPRPLLPPEGVVCVVAARLDLPPEILAAISVTLAPDEQERAARFVTQTLRDHFTAGRGLLRALLGLATGRAPADLAFDYGPEGKPRLAPGSAAALDGSPVSFNASHSKGVILVALARGLEVGIDLEHVQLRSHVEIADRFFHPDEAAWVRALPEEAQREGFFSVWSAKEAFIKCTGKGLSQGLSSFKFRCGPQGPEALGWIEGEPVEKYYFTPLAGPEGFKSALVADGRVGRVEQLALPSTVEGLRRTLWDNLEG